MKEIISIVENHMLIYIIVIFGFFFLLLGLLSNWCMPHKPPFIYWYKVPVWITERILTCNHASLELKKINCLIGNYILAYNIFDQDRERQALIEFSFLFLKLNQVLVSLKNSDLTSSILFYIWLQVTTPLFQNLQKTLVQFQFGMHLIWLKINWI